MIERVSIHTALELARDRFAAGVAGWNVYNGVVSHEPVDGYGSRGAAEFELAVNGGGGIYRDYPAAGAGELRSLSVYVKGTAGAQATLIARETGGAAPLAQTTDTVILTGAWQRLHSEHTFEQPDRTAFQVVVELGGAIGDDLLVDELELYAGARPDLALADVFAGVSITRGRASIDEGPLSSSASLSIVNVDRPFAAGFRVGRRLEIDGLAAPRFRGRITDATLDGSGGVLSLVAIGTLPPALTRPIGADAWPEEPWSDRVGRAFTEAELTAELVLEVGDEDPLLAARAADPTTLGAYLEELAETVPAAVADRPDGSVLVQAVSSRKGAELVELAPELVELELPWTMLEDVANAVELEWAGGTVLVEDAASIADHDRRHLSITTELVERDSAEDRARLELRRRAWPAWALEAVSLLELDESLELGARLLVGSLPPAAPKDRHVGVLEGWTESVYAAGDAGARELVGRMALNLSPAILSGAGVSWAEVDPALTWADATETDWIDTEELLNA